MKKHYTLKDKRGRRYALAENQDGTIDRVYLKKCKICKIYKIPASALRVLCFRCQKQIPLGDPRLIAEKKKGNTWEFYYDNLRIHYIEFPKSVDYIIIQLENKKWLKLDIKKTKEFAKDFHKMNLEIVNTIKQLEKENET